LGLVGEQDYFTLLYEQRAGLWYIRESQELCRSGLSIQLAGYQSQVYLGIREVYDTDGLYRRLWEELAGRGTEDIERARKKLYLRPIHSAFRMLLQDRLTELVHGALYQEELPSAPAEDELLQTYESFLDACLSLGYGREAYKREALTAFHRELTALRELAPFCRPERRPQPPSLEGYLNRGLAMLPEASGLLLGQMLLAPLRIFIADDARYPDTAVCAEDLMLPELLHRLYGQMHIPEDRYPALDALLLALLERSDWHRLLENTPAPEESAPSPAASTDDSPAASSADSTTDSSDKTGAGRSLLEHIIRAPYAARLLQLNRHMEIEWFRGEALQELLWWIALRMSMQTLESGEDMDKAGKLFHNTVARWLEAEEKAAYRVELLLQQL
jgi:hypothetical protein